jgi:hypothetical protein
MTWITGNQAHVRAEQVNAIWTQGKHVYVLVRDQHVQLSTADDADAAQALAAQLVKQIEQAEEPTGIQTKVVGGTDRELTPKERQLLTLTYSDRIMEQTVAHLLGCSVGQLAEHAIVKTLTKQGYIVHVVDGDKGFYYSTPKGREAIQ